MGLDSSNFATDFSNPEKSKVADTAVYGAMPAAPGKAGIPIARLPTINNNQIDTKPSFKSKESNKIYDKSSSINSRY